MKPRLPRRITHDDRHLESSEPILHGILDQVKAQCAMQHSLGDIACVTQVSDMRPTLYVGCQPSLMVSRALPRQAPEA